MRDEEQDIYSLLMEHKTFNYERWIPQHLIMRYGIYSIYSREMESTAITEKWGIQHLFWREMQSTAFTRDRCCPQHLLIRDGMASIFSKQSTAFTHDIALIESTAFSKDGCSPKHGLSRGDVHTYLKDMESKALTSKRWSPQHFLLRDGANKIY